MALPKFIISPEMRFGQLIVVAEVEREKRLHSNMRAYLCKCDCGAEDIKAGIYLRSGEITSFGCYAAERRRNTNRARLTKHGLSRHPLYRVWKSMRNRCLNQNFNYWKDYGGRGITICDAWKENPVVFIQWALTNGWVLGLEINRIDNDGNYEPGNCDFVTRIVNQQNKRPRRKEYGA